MASREFEKIALSHLDEITAFAQRICMNSWDADELIQSTYERAFSCWSDLSDIKRCRAWLFRIARNLHLDRARAVAARPELRLVRPTDSVAPEPSVSSTTVSRATAHDLEYALKQISEERREAVLLADLWGFTYAEIAEIVGVPIGTVRSRISRGRKAMIDHLAEVGFLTKSGRGA